MGMFASFAVFAAVDFWFPKISGKILNEGVGRIGFWLNFIGVNVTFWPLFIIGVQGMPRRYADYSQFPQFEPYHHIATYGAFMVAVGMAITIGNWIYSAAKGRVSENNPWGSNSLEWTHCPNPPGPGNFPVDVVVAEDWSPYNYHR
jgi:cytochrome c oxidase subunit 1